MFKLLLLSLIAPDFADVILHMSLILHKGLLERFPGYIFYRGFMNASRMIIEISHLQRIFIKRFRCENHQRDYLAQPPSLAI